MVDNLPAFDPQSQELPDDATEEPLEDPSTTDLPSFDIGLSPAGDAGSSYRTQNDPGAPFQRSNYVERQGAVDIRCSCIDVIHGLFAPDSDVFATLIVLQFRFDARKRARRFHSVDISLEFGGTKPGEGGPEVFAIAPVGRMSLVPSTQYQEVKQHASLHLGGAAPIGGITAAGKVGWEKCVSRDTTDETTVTGSIDLKGRNWGKSNCASWTLLENKTTKTGVPASMRTAILLKRKDENPFQCVVKIDANVDFKSTVERVFGRKGKDDPVLFNPEFKPTNKLQQYDIENLGAFDLEDVCDVTFATMLAKAIKDKAQKGEV